MYIMYNRVMVRKQLYLRPEHERLLKQKARETGLSEAELMRQALDQFFRDVDAPLPGHVEALGAFLREAQQISKQHRLPAEWRFRREEAYTREARWEREKT
ncbi:Tchh; trichohyalin [Meiothermus ruber DSM 1279]|uniref:Tchh trichohyalin n=2 Tax=Meiothermus ruber (strain ATCC 35948 / DSM 1279 / VKM B-1258 / 21) TaxID=504728 RepID=A0A806CHY5_MEIRD|nr:Tchh; trichohyalin [Meiothermus ruber DSM 1279]